MMTFGIGDALLRYPQLVAPVDENALRTLPERFVAVHPYASESRKCMPEGGVLLDWLRRGKVPFIVLGNETPAEHGGPWFNFGTQMQALRRARKFIGTLSCFNCAAQLIGIPSFVIANRSIGDKPLYQRMHDNGTVIRHWNASPQSDIWAIYAEAVEWAAK